MSHVQNRPGKPLPYVVRWRNEAGQERTKAFRLKRDADAFRTEIDSAALRGHLVDPSLGRTAFAVIADEWLATRINLKASTTDRDRQYLRSIVNPGIGEMHIAKIKRSTLQRFVNELVGSGLAPATISKAMQIVSMVLTFAVDDGMIAKNPTQGVNVPRVENREMRIVTMDRVHDLADVIDQRYAGMVLIAAYTGMRFGEVTGLHVPDVDLLRGEVSVRRTLSEVRGGVVLTKPKTAAAVRTIKIGSTTVDTLAEALVDHDGGYVFTAPKGGPIRRRSWRSRFWLPAVQEIGEPELVFHDLRHTHASMLIAEGIDVATVSERLGHASKRVTLDTYTHLWPGRGEAAAEVVERVIGHTNDRRGKPHAGQRRGDPPENVIEMPA